MADAAAEGSNAFAQGVEAQGALSNQRRQTAAYNMLSAAYGPVAGFAVINPQAAEAGETIQTAAPTAQANLASAQAEAPLRQAQTAQAQANTTNLSQSNAATAGIRGARMLQAIANPDGSIPQDEAAHILSNPAYNLDQTHIQNLVGQMAKPGGKAVLDTIVSALQSGGKVSGPATVVTNPDGTTSIIRTTTTGGEVNTNIGGSQTAQQGREHVYAADDPRRVQIAQQNANTNTYSAGTRSNNTAFGAAPNTVLPAQRGVAPPAAGANGAPAVPQLTGKPLATRTAQAQIVQNADTNTGTAAQMLDQAMSQANAYTTGAGSWGDWLRGSQAANLRANLSAIRGQVGSAIISSMKNAQGQMGFRMTQAEFKTLTDSLGALGQEQSADQLKQHLTFARNAINKFNQAMHDNFKTQWGTDPYSATGSTPPGGAQPAPQEIVNELRKRGVVK